MKATCGILILLLAVLTTCKDDPYPVYQEGELLWIVTDTPSRHEGSDMEPHITPDGNQVVYRDAYAKGSNNSRLMKRDLSTGVESLIHDNGQGLDLSPDGQWLVFSSSAGTVKVKLNGDSLSVLPLKSDYGNRSPAWGPEGIVYVHSAKDANDVGGLYVFTRDGKNEFVAANSWPPDFFPDGKRIIAGKSFDQSIWKKFIIYDLETKEELVRLDASPNESNEDPQVSPGGDQILYWNKSGIYLMNSDGSNVQIILPSEHFYEHQQGDYLGFLAASASWHPDGKHIVYQHFAITKYEKCTGYCFESETFTGIVSIRKLRVVE